MAGRLDGRVALITGATSGIGEASARLFAAEGARVAITGRRRDRGEAIVRDLRKAGAEALYVHADHVRAEDCERSVHATIDRYGRIDVLFNNAGIVTSGTAESTTEETWERTLALNVTAVWRMSRLVLPIFREQGGGVIVNNASDWAVVGGKNALAYCASKGAVAQITRSMALDHGRENVRVNAVCPGDTFVERWVETGYFDNAPREKVMQIAGDELPIGRVGQADEIARVALFLACDDSSFMTGALVLADGGNTAG